MGLFGSLYTGTSGLIAGSRSTSFVSQNIANSNTNGYKKSQASFYDIVAQSSGLSNFATTGAVGVSEVKRVDVQGLLQQTTSGTDAAISGNGFYVVKEQADDTLDFFYTRVGSFIEDQNSTLRNVNGQVLYGLPIGADGTVTGSLSDTNSLVPIDLSTFDTQIRPTSVLDIGLNLNASQYEINQYLVGGSDPITLADVSSQPSHFSQSFKVVDNTGVERQVSLEFRKVLGPMASFTGPTGSTLTLSDVLAGDSNGPTPGIADGDQLVITDLAGNNIAAVTFVAGAADKSLGEANTMEDLLDVLNDNSNGALRARIDAEGNFVVQATDPTISLDISTSSASVLGSTGFRIPQNAEDPIADYVFEPPASLTENGDANPNQTDFPAFANTTDPNTQHWWDVRVLTIDPADPSGSDRVEISRGLINFDGDGNLNAVDDGSGITINLSGVDFDDSITTDDTSFIIDFTNTSQFAGNFDVISSDQDGVPAGTRTGAEITSSGIVRGIFANGIVTDLYQIPLATFSNPNGLESVIGTLFAEHPDAGDLVLANPGTQSAGDLVAFTVEGSNVDITDEFAQLIVGQRAFSANSRLINTVDQMVEALARLKQ